MIWALKYRGIQAVGENLGARLYDHLTEDLADASLFGGGDPHFIVIPIPLAATRARERGYNQATAIARGFVGRANRRGHENFTLIENLLRRDRDTGSQTAIKARRARLANVRGVFAVVEGVAVRGKQIIIVDDVITTGGTTNAARHALEAAGAKIVIAAALAHG